jgi:hypothetical protein
MNAITKAEFEAMGGAAALFHVGGNIYKPVLTEQQYRSLGVNGTYHHKIGYVLDEGEAYQLETPAPATPKPAKATKEGE